MASSYSNHLIILTILVTLTSVIKCDNNNNIILEEGYTVTTLIDGDKFTVNPYAVVSLYGSSSDDLVILDSVKSTFYTVTVSGSQVSEIKKLSGNDKGNAGYKDGDLGSAEFNKPKSFTVDKKNNIYIADKSNHVIRKISKSGVTTIAGGNIRKTGKADGPAQNASFSDDFELAFDSQRCALLISDHGNRLIRQLDLKAEDCADTSSGPAAMDGSSGGDEFAVGCLLSIKTTFGDEFEGQIITFDRPSNILVLQEGLKSNPQSRRNIRLLKANYIKEFSFLGQSEDPLDLNKCYLDLNSLQSKEDAAVRQAEIDVERIGVGVTAEAQSIFDALSKTLPVRWDKTAIVVMNEVRVSSPYLAESVTGGTPAANERVRKVLELERRRLQTRGGGQ